MGQDGLEQQLEVAALAVGAAQGDARLGVGVEDGELQLVLVGPQVDEQVVELVLHLGDAPIRAVDLVDHRDQGQALFQGLGEHEAGLGQGPLRGVHQEHHPVHHVQGALHLAAEVGVAGVSTMLSFTPW